MPKRRASKHTRAPRPLLAGGYQRREVRGSVTYIVRDVPAHRSTKTYTCPGCQHSIAPGTGHIVAWPEQAPYGSQLGLEARRHWHQHCWGLA